MNKIAGYTFTAASLGMFIMILLYVVALQTPAGDWLVKVAHIEANWTLLATHWRIEFLCAVALSWVALHFSSRSSWWYLVAIGHMLMLVEYVLMLGGYPEVKSEEGFHLVNQMAIWVFAASNLVWLAGMVGVYSGASAWLKSTGMVLSGVCALIFLAFVLGFVTMKQAAIAGPLVMLLYLLNAWYGIRVLSKT
jgi:hypothetical protein